MDTLDTRLQILRQSGLLSEESVEKANALRAFFLRQYGIVLTEENAAAFFTHLCMALHRMETGEEIAPVSAPLYGDLQAQPDYQTACAMAEEINSHIISLPTWEHGYIVMHLVVLLGRSKR